MMAWTTGHYLPLRQGPYRHKIILPSSQYVLPVWRPADTHEATVVARVQVR